MATLREIKGRIDSVKNTRKITRTMELVSTAKAKKAVDRVTAAQPFADKINELIRALSSGTESDHPLLRRSDQVKKAGVLIVTANRGLCGAFNANILKLAQAHITELEKQGIDTQVELIGKKAISYFRFRNMPYIEGHTHIDDNVEFEQAREFADRYMQNFINAELDQVEIIYTRYYSAGSQKPVIDKVMPLSLESAEDESESANKDYIFEPDPETILNSLLPRAIRMKFYQPMLDSAASEQIARRIAMKSATDAASDMIKSMTLTYNRARQGKITQEIAEIVGGAAAIE